MSGTRAASDRLHLVRADALDVATTQTPGMVRFAAVSGSRTGAQALWMGLNRVAPGTRSDDHHHGSSETGIYVVAGHPVFVFAEEGEEKRLEAGPGDFLFVPPFVPHREENPGEEDAVVVLARSTEEAIVVNLSSLFGSPPGA